MVLTTLVTTSPDSVVGSFIPTLDHAAINDFDELPGNQSKPICE